MEEASLFADLKKVYRALGAEGPVQTGRRVSYSIRLRAGLWADRRFDRRHGVDTRGRIPLVRLMIESKNREHGVEYDPTPIGLTRWILRQVPEVETFSFVDFGSGKGRVLLRAAEYPFRRVIGVEFAAELHQVALRNMERFRSRRRRCAEITSVNVDATQFELPDGPCVFYFYVPFKPPVMSQVIRNIERSYHSQPRKMYFLYAKPWYRDILDELDWVQLKALRRPWWSGLSHDPMEVLVYETSDEPKA